MFIPAEPIPTAFLLGVLGLLLLASVMLKPVLDRVGVPVALLFLGLGMVAGSDGFGWVAFDDFHLAFRLGHVALILILLDGGLNTPLRAVRRAIVPAGILATAGVALTAALTALGARALGLAWSEALLLGAVVSSTDAAAVFAVLRGSGLTLRPRVGSILEIESGLNDPMAVILTIAVTTALLTGSINGWALVWGVPLQLLIGAAAGIGLAWLARWTLGRFPLATAGLYPVLTLATGLVAFGLATVAQGSGFLAVYIAGIVLGNGPLPNRSGLVRVHDALAWLCQIGMFLMLGLLVLPSRLPAVAGVGLAIAVLLTLIARPLAVAACLLPLRLPRREVLYTGWVGLRGAVPIILATIPVLAELPGSRRVFDIVFFVVVINALVPGSTIGRLARRMNLHVDQTPTPRAVLEINALRPLDADLISFCIDPSLAVAGATLAQIAFPPGAAAVMLVRGDSLLPCRGDTRLNAGDHVYIFCPPADRPFIELLFGRPQQIEV
ncbi:MAG TPA: potassium/proton antiporter [Phycisphaerales bacterium]|nr:potassium/proton antiporter [Phycisphaerales bacterium]